MNDSGKKSWKDDVVRDVGTMSKKGYIAIALTLGVFLVWAILSPLSGAVVATGKIIASGQNKVLQHPSGGVIKRIVARNGAKLNKGDLVAIVEPSAAIAELAQLEARKNLLVAMRSRLDASKSNIVQLARFDPAKGASFQLRGALVAQQSTNSDLVYSEQQAELEAGTARYQGELSALENQLSSLEGEFDSVERQISRNTAKMRLMNERRRKMVPLVSKGYMAKAQLWTLDAERLDISSTIDALQGSFDALPSRMDEVKDRIDVLKATKDQDSSRELTEILSELGSIEERIAAASKIVEYSEIRAPEAGTLTNFLANTVGGVVEAGAVIAEIVPVNLPLEAEVQIMPADVGSVTIGQEAKIVITALNARLDDPVVGTVNYISADSTLDPNTGEPFFKAKIALKSSAGLKAKIHSGMYAQVFIQTEPRNFLSYAFQPITDSFKKAFNER